jgi:hypothetical protein
MNKLPFDKIIVVDSLDNPNIIQENIDKVTDSVVFLCKPKQINFTERNVLFNKSLDYAYQLSKQSRVRNYD